MNVDELAKVLAGLRRKRWVVYAKRPFGGPKQVLRYLARYTHRVGIDDRRILAVDEHGVSFANKDYRDSSRSKTMRLNGGEFRRRFSMHVLPRGFTRLRSIGLLANNHRERNPALSSALRRRIARARTPRATTGGAVPHARRE